MVAELPFLWARPAGVPILPKVRFEGEALLSEALAQGKGVLLLTPHMGCFEVTAQAIAERFGATRPITVLYRPARQPWLRDLVRTSRERQHLFAAPATLTGVRQMIRALRRGEMVATLSTEEAPVALGWESDIYLDRQLVAWSGGSEPGSREYDRVGPCCDGSGRGRSLVTSSRTRRRIISLSGSPGTSVVLSCVCNCSSVAPSKAPASP